MTISVYNTFRGLPEIAIALAQKTWGPEKGLALVTAGAGLLPLSLALQSPKAAIRGSLIGVVSCLCASIIAEVQDPGFFYTLKFSQLGIPKELPLEMRRIVLLCCIHGPIFEEWIFRGMIQSVYDKLLASVLPDKKVKLGIGDPVPLAKIVSAIVTSILFGLFHVTSLPSDISPSERLALQDVIRWQPIFVTITSLFFCIAKEKYGLTGAFWAHMTHNFLVTLQGRAFLNNA
jgi:membrane protease YdiL (CAAX protease family)